MALVQYLEACPSSQSTLTDACRCKPGPLFAARQEIRFREVQCLPRFINISEWIKSRGQGIQINEADSTICLSRGPKRHATANPDCLVGNLPQPKRMRVTVKPASKPMPKHGPKPPNTAPPFHLRFECFKDTKIQIWTAAECDLKSLGNLGATTWDVRMWSDPHASHKLRRHDGGHPVIIRRLLQRKPEGDTPTFAGWLKQRLEEWKTQVVKDQALKIMLY